MNKLARMLDVMSVNTSNNHSSRNSLKKSRSNKTGVDRRNLNVHMTSADNSLLMSPNTIH